MAKTGNTGAITFGTSGFTGAFTTIGEWSPEIGELEDSDLSTTDFKTFIPDDLANPGEIAIELQFDPAADLPLLGGDPRGTPETITITFPLTVAGGTAATLVGTGWFKKLGTPELKNGQIMLQKGTVKFDGKTGPAFTAQAAPAP